MQIHAYAAPEAKAQLSPFTYEQDDLTAFEAEIEISHCGVCHSDLHLVDGDWGSMSQYPIVPGHEIIGTVTSVGSAADSTLIGKRVGIGWQKGSCLHCDTCITGQEQFCNDKKLTCVRSYGGFAEKIVVDSRFATVIPDSISSDNAAPLLCAGITVFSPLMHYANSNSHVGVIGIGGLGHLALQFANKMGCDVTAFSTTEAKKDEAIQLGAENFINGKDATAMKAMRNTCDVIIATAPANIDWTPYVSALRSNGVLCFVGIPSQPVSMPVGYIMPNKAIAGSSTGGRYEMRQMFEFAARHDIAAWTETLPMDSVNTALDRLRNNDVRYRFVFEK